MKPCEKVFHIIFEKRELDPNKYNGSGDSIKVSDDDTMSSTDEDDIEEDDCFEEDPYQEVSKKFQLVYAFQGKAEYPHYVTRLKGHNKDAKKRARLHLFTHLQERVQDLVCDHYLS